MNNWKETTLGEISEKITKGTTPTTEGGGFVNFGVNFIKAEAISEDGRFLKHKFAKIDEETNKKLKRSIIHEHDILFSIAGVIGRVALVQNDILPANTNQALAIIRLNHDRVDSKFVYYYLSNKQQIKYANSLVSQSVQANINLVQLGGIPIPLPSLLEQKQIAAVLGSLDDKIELLRAENKTLEKIAQGIFKEWFVNFTIDGKKLKLKNGVPEEWRIGKIYETGKIVCGKTPSKENPDYFGGKIPFIKIPDMHGQMFILNTNDKLSKNGADSQKTKTIPINSICVSCIATVGLVSITTEDSQTNQQINSVIPNNENLIEFLFFTLRAMSESLNSIGSSGTTTANVNTGTFMNLEILIPTEECLLLFHKTVSPIFCKIKENNYQIQTLSRLRDTLLPKLMSGRIEI